MSNTKYNGLVSGITTATVMVNIPLGSPVIDYYLSEINEATVEFHIPTDSYENPYYTIVPQDMALEDQIESIHNFESSKDLSKEIQERLSSEELEKARELLQLAVKYFPDEKSFSIAKNIIAPPKVISTNKSETEGIHETIQFFRNVGKRFEKKWIAVSKGQLLDVSDSYSILAETYKDRNIFITKVL